MPPIRLRPWKPDDIPQLIAIANNPKVIQHLRDSFPSPYTESDASFWVETAQRQEPLSDFAIEFEEKAVGSIGFRIQDDVYRKNAEIGYFIGEVYWGRGIASQAVQQLTEYIFSRCDALRLYAGIFSSNPASMRVLAKNGFHQECIHRAAVYKQGRWLDEHLWVKFRPGFVVF